MKREEYKEEQFQSGLVNSLIDSIQDIVFYKDVDGIYLGCNKKFLQFVGKERDEVIGKTDYDLFDGETADRFRYFDQTMLGREQPSRYEEWLKYPDGRECLFDTVKTPYRAYDGSLLGIVGISRDITERKKKEEKIRFLSFHDQLTGLYNRRYYEEQLSALDVEFNYPLTIAMGDVNGLKFINDAFGHEMGDDLLKKVAEAIRKACRADDVTARIGGDEFVIILPRTDATEAENVVRRIKNLLAEERVGALAVSVSFGSATKTMIKQNMHDLFRDCEDRMYRNKLWERGSLRSKTIDVVLHTLYEKSVREMEHSIRVADICEMIAKKLNFTAADIEQIKLAGLMHDIGKISVDEKILDKAGDFSNYDWEHIRKHPETGYRILSSANEFTNIALYVHQHHEWWDGTGYPNCLRAEEIALPARIIAIAEAYDAMTADRADRKNLSKLEAALEIKRWSGTQFDPALAEIFAQTIMIPEHSEKTLVPSQMMAYNNE